MIFTAKMFESQAEIQAEKAVISDYLGDFFLVWFYQLAIWHFTNTNS